MQNYQLLRAGHWGALLLGTLLTLPAAGAEFGAGADDAAGVALARARSATSPEQLKVAAQGLEALLARYPQDVDIPLQLAWLKFRTSRYADALYSYGLALQRSTPGGEAELGLAFTLVKLERCAEARGHFQAVLNVTPMHSSALDGLRQCTHPPAPAPVSRLWISPLVGQSVYLYDNQPVISYAVAPMGRVEALWRDRFYGAVAYRYSYFGTHDGKTAAWSQHDLYLDAGITAKAAGVTLHYALLADGSGYSGTTNHVGLTARYSHGFDTLLNLSASFYKDATNLAASAYKDAPVLRGELAWLLPVVGGFGVRPGGALQWTPTATYKTVSLSLSYYHRYFSVWLGGKYGDEKRAAYLNIAYIYNSPATIPYGFWAGAAIRPGAKFELTLSYAYDRLVRSDTTPPQDSTVQSRTISISREF